MTTNPVRPDFQPDGMLKEPYYQGYIEALTQVHGEDLVNILFMVLKHTGADSFNVETIIDQASQAGSELTAKFYIPEIESANSDFPPTQPRVVEVTMRITNQQA